MRKQYTSAFKAKVVQELLKEEKTLAHIASEYEVHPTQLKKWRTTSVEGLSSLFERQDSTAELKEAYEKQVTELYADRFGSPKDYSECGFRAQRVDSGPGRNLASM